MSTKPSACRSCKTAFDGYCTSVADAHADALMTCGACKTPLDPCLCEDCAMDDMRHCDGCDGWFHPSCRAVARCNGMPCDGAEWCAVCKPLTQCAGEDCLMTRAGGYYGGGGGTCAGCMHCGGWVMSATGPHCEDCTDKLDPNDQLADSDVPAFKDQAEHDHYMAGTKLIGVSWCDWKHARQKAAVDAQLAAETTRRLAAAAGPKQRKDAEPATDEAAAGED